MRVNQTRSFKAEISSKAEVGWKGFRQKEPPEVVAQREQIGDRRSALPTWRRKLLVYPR